MSRTDPNTTIQKVLRVKIRFGQFITAAVEAQADNKTTTAAAAMDSNTSEGMFGQKLINVKNRKNAATQWRVRTSFFAH